MKKQNQGVKQDRKLSLSISTVRKLSSSLTDQQLQEVAGGAAPNGDRSRPTGAC